MKVLVTFKISKGFEAWLKMVDDIQPIMDELGIKMHWAGTNLGETRVYDLVEVNNPEDAKVFAQREDVAKAESEAGVEVESTETLSVIIKDKFW